jgi:hypothetical protein
VRSDLAIKHNIRKRAQNRVSQISQMLVVIFTHKNISRHLSKIIKAMLPQALPQAHGDECSMRHCSLPDI